MKSLAIRRALLAFLFSYIVITVLAFGLYLLIAAIMGVSQTAEFDIRHDPAYALAEQLYPILNTFIWAGFATWYFRTRRPVQPMREAWLLGAFWLAIAVPLDLIYFVLIPNPLQVSAEGFYIEQFPWIYLTYLVVLISPAIAVLVSRWRKNGVWMRSNQSAALPE